MTKFYRVDGAAIPVNFKCEQPLGFPCPYNNQQRDCTKCKCAVAVMEAADFLKIIEKVEA